VVPTELEDGIVHEGVTADRVQGQGPRHLSFGAFVLLSTSLVWRLVPQLMNFAETHDYGSHILLVLPISAYFIYVQRHQIFSRVNFNVISGTILFVASVAVELLARAYVGRWPDLFSLEVAGLVGLWLAGFLFFYGAVAFRKASFPLLFLFFLVPLPDFLVSRVITWLQAGSSAVAFYLFQFFHVPVVRNGFVLHLPPFDLHVEQECSGIRSSMVLLLTVVVASQFILRSPWRKLLLAVACVPMLVIKNGIRIASIYLLATRVDAGFLHGRLHSSGGIVFYFLGMAALIPVAVWLRKGETNQFGSSAGSKSAEDCAANAKVASS
jgi:exosortase